MCKTQEVSVPGAIVDLKVREKGAVFEECRN